MKHALRIPLLVSFTSLFASCASPGASDALPANRYTDFALTTDTSQLTERERQMIPLLIDAAREMERIFWLQAYGDPEGLLASAEDDELRRSLEINFGPWDRLSENSPFMSDAGAKPKGANFYPADMTAEEFEAHLAAHPEDEKAFRSLYTVLRRNQDGKLVAVPYHEFFTGPTRRAAEKLRAAAELAEDAGLRRYLELRATALETDDYQPSDLAWMDMKDNTLDVVIGPIENYEDHLFGYKAAHEAYVLVKDKAWSERLARYATFLPGLQRGLPVPEEYKREQPGTDSDLNAYDVIYVAGDCNAGSKTIAINLPNDPEVQLAKGTRRLQLKNAMRAKFDKILVPISGELITPDQRAHITFDAFFANTMFHEVAHGLGIKQTLTTGETVRTALKELGAALEEGKADILGLYMVTQLADQGELAGADVRDNYVTFLASIFRSVRFGASSAHGRANMIRFNFFRERGAFSREFDGTYRVDFERMRTAMDELSRVILVLQGDGDYAGTERLFEEYGFVGEDLQADLDRLSEAGIPVDIVFEQGLEVLGLGG